MSTRAGWEEHMEFVDFSTPEPQMSMSLDTQRLAVIASIPSLDSSNLVQAIKNYLQYVGAKQQEHVELQNGFFVCSVMLSGLKYSSKPEKTEVAARNGAYQLLAYVLNGEGQETVTVLNAIWKRFRLSMVRRCVYSSLGQVNLSSAGIDDDALNELVRALCGNNVIKSLDLSNNCFCHVTTLCEMFRSNLSIEDLKLSGNCIGNEENCEMISLALRSNSVLRTLDLTSTKINNYTCGKLAKGLTLNSSFVKLNLSSNTITDVGFSGLLCALENNKNAMEEYLGQSGLLCMDENDINGSSDVGKRFYELSLEGCSLTVESLQKVVDLLDKCLCIHFKLSGNFEELGDLHNRVHDYITSGNLVIVG
eukprot:TRINITY_DN1065_c0_g1_i1.p1 TRINITY_DN1065_c0_g1~~TRINITY_DN1065_c0_g1_i1.p1  ORF type:complete len:364 (+),score=71.56 TRINITY_DN1065_c0_g1_i1:65-1156(+)